MQVGEQFRGVKMIPPRQVHFFSAGAKGVRVGCFVRFEPEQVLLTRWSPFHERLFHADEPGFPASAGSSAEDDLERYTQGVRRFDFDKNLAALPYYLPASAQPGAAVGALASPSPSGPEALDEWALLTSHVTPSLLQMLSLPYLTWVHPGAAATEEEVDAEIARARQALRGSNPDTASSGGDTLERSSGASKQPQTNSLPGSRRTTTGARREEDLVRTPQFCGAAVRQRRLVGMTATEVTQYNTNPDYKLDTLLRQCYRGDWVLLLGKRVSQRVRVEVSVVASLRSCSRPTCRGATGRLHPFSDPGLARGVRAVEGADLLARVVLNGGHIEHVGRTNSRGVLFFVLQSLAMPTPARSARYCARRRRPHACTVRRRHHGQQRRCQQ
eukprot:scaffold3158_cov389-Prasinococcus_capsulatus_cf.AAC.16